MDITELIQTGDLNQNGGDELTINGFGFPTVTSYVNVEFADGSGCTVTSSSPN